MSDKFEITKSAPRMTVNEGRLVINDAFTMVTPAGLLQRTRVAADKHVVIPADMQLIVYGTYRVDGTLDIDGELIIL